MNPTFVEQLGRFAERLPELERGSCSRDEIYNIRQFLEKNSASYIEVISNDTVREKWEALKHAISKLDGDQGTHVTVTQAATATLGGAATPLAAATPQDAASWDDLADEVVVEILMKLPPKEIGQARRVSQRMRALGTIALVKKINNEKLSFADIGVKDVTSFLNSLGDERTKLHHLDLRGIEIVPKHIEGLLKACPNIKSIFLDRERLSAENLSSILDLAVKTESKELTGFCLEYAINNGFILDELIVKMQGEFNNMKAATLLQHVKTIKSNEAELSIEQGLFVVTLGSLSDDINPATQALCDATLLILDLRLIPNLSDTELKNVMEKIPNLTRICIKSAAITTVHDAERLEWLQCDNCTSLTSVSAPQAITFIANGCTALTSIKAPRAQELQCNDCTALTFLEALLAERLWCENCTSLTSVSAPRALEIIANGCTALTSLEALLAQELQCHGCTALTSVSAPRALVIYCYGCTALTSLEALLVQTLWCWDCTSLTSIKAPQALDIRCHTCTVLTSIEAQLVQKLWCENCSALTSIKAPRALDIRCSECTAITSIEAQLVQKLKCFRCTSLTSISVPQALELNCNWCTALTFIEALLAQNILCNYCPALTIVTAPLAQELWCGDCSKLTKAGTKVPSSCVIHRY